MNEWFTVENLETLSEQYRTLGPIIGILLPFLESLLPFLPLVVIVVANASSYGLWLGFLLSWIGTVCGSYFVFLVVRQFGHHRKFKRFVQGKRIRKLIDWVDMKGLTPLLIFLCFPFTPSVLVNIVAGLSNIKRKYYLFVLMAGKLVMIFSISVLGYDIKSFFAEPWKLIVSIIGLVILWFISKSVERRLNKKVEKDLRDVAKQKNSKKR